MIGWLLVTERLISELPLYVLVEPIRNAPPKNQTITGNLESEEIPVGLWIFSCKQSSSPEEVDELLQETVNTCTFSFHDLKLQLTSFHSKLAYLESNCLKS